jgi:GTP:adenosylcobinamide-phosphate guanylyltransferase
MIETERGELQRSFTALVLAGRRGGEDPLASHCRVAYKCLALAAGVPMLVRVVDALAASSSVERIFIVLEDPTILDSVPAIRAWRREHACAALAGAATPSLSVLKALDEIPASLPMLVTTADHPLLTPEIIEHFCAAARTTAADVVAGVTAAEVIRAAYPDTQRTYLRFRDGPCSGANPFALLTPGSCPAVAFWRRVEQERKRPWRLVRAFGPGPLLAYLCGRLTLDSAMARASAIIGAQVAAIRLPFAEAAIDVDKPADLALVEAILGRRAGV